MLFYIDKSVGEYLSNQEPTSRENAIFSTFATAIQNGYCIACGDFNSLVALSKLNPIYQKVISNYASHRAIIERVNRLFFISITESIAVPDFVTCSRHTILLSDIINYDLRMFELCNLLCENLNDCEYYSLLGMYYCKQNAIREYTLDFSRHNGAGDLSATVYRNLVCREKKPVLCICDSDFRYGDNCTLGKTASDVQQAESTFCDNHAPFFSYILPVHEVENIVPLSILAAVYRNQENLSDILQLLEELSHIDEGRPALFYDYKKGIPNLSGEDDMSRYWLDISNSVKGSLGKFGGTFPQIADRKYMKRVLMQVEKIVLQPEQMLNIDDFLVEILNDLGQTVFSWGCVGRPMYV